MKIVKEHENQVPRRAVKNSPPLYILQSRFVIGQLEKLSIKVSRALTLVVEHEFVITTICAYHCIKDCKREKLLEICNDFRLKIL